jgi:hypothetical protein
MRTKRWTTAALVLGTILGSFASAQAADQLLLGRTFTVKDPDPANPLRRAVKFQVADRSFNTVVGDPTVSGATLRVIINGATPSDETYVLPAAQWRGRVSASGSSSYRFSGGYNTGNVVKRASIRGTPRFGKVDVDGLLGGKYGPLAVVPPNPGTEAIVVFTIVGGDTYCTAWGGAAGGKTKDTATAYYVSKPTSVIGSCPP